VFRVSRTSLGSPFSRRSPLFRAKRLITASRQPRASKGIVLSCSILIVDDSAPIRRSLRALIERDEDWRICGEAENGEIAVEKVKELQPDIVILDLQMPVMDGLEAGRQIALVAPGTAMVLFTMHSCDQLVRDARAVGIKEVVSKSDGLPTHLLAALKGARPGL
jgi:DNA-binding NarL/FixJ family response regulator